MKSKLTVVLVTILLVVYLLSTLQRAWIMFTSEQFIAKMFAVALFVLPIIGFWALCKELVFGYKTAKLAKVLEQENGLPVDNLERTAAGRVVRESADLAFVEYKFAAQQSPQDWRVWFRLSCIYDAAGDRKRARQTMRKAINFNEKV